ncbi:MAG: hypothetical protein PUH29_09380, partial [Lachnospiraceae bacterium]|nr:hypothetical protein [Lachnospiraceae bacterium]
INSSKLACLLDIGACVAVMIVPHGTGAMMAQEAVGCTYIEVLKYQFYPLLLLIFSAVSIQFGNGMPKLKKRDEKKEKNNYENYEN